nr:GAP family protein [Salinibacterium sp.]
MTGSAGWPIPARAAARDAGGMLSLPLDLPLELALPLLALALVDSLSFGTLLIPIWLLLAPGRLRASRVLVFLATVAVFYFGVGLLLTAGAVTFLSDAEFLEGPVAGRVQFVIGAGLLVWSFFIGRKKTDAAGEGADATPGRLLRWRDRAMHDGGGRGSLLSLMALALTAAVLELATMLPYLAAVGLISGSELDGGTRAVTLAAYCAVMVVPALVLLAARILARRLVEPLLQRLAAWMAREGAETTSWIVGIVGFLVARDAISRVPELTDVLGFIS